MATASMQSNHCETDFSAPWMRTSLLNTPTYVALADFDSQVIWMKTGNQYDLMIAPHDNKHTPLVRATCAVVGTVSGDRLFLDAHGNFNSTFEDAALETSKAQFQLVCPDHHPDFKSDFQISMKHIENLQRKAATEGPSPQYFIVLDGPSNEKAIKFSWPLFEKRSRAYNSTDEEDWTNGYPISVKFHRMFENIVHKWHANPLPAFDAQGKFIKVNDLEFSLKGSLVLVQFNLRHYAIRDKRTNGITSNTFTATATQVQILEPATTQRPSPYKSLMLKGPTFLPQSPSKRNDQVRAVNTFHPGNMDTSPCFLVLPNFTSKLTILLTGASNVNLANSTNAETSQPDSTTKQTLIQDDVGSRPLSKADGKKRVVDEDNEATATEGESSIVEGPLKKKKKQNK
ncbi:hypothetical protein BYT27DRAFT_7255660 [Phlegmacium glaucopus]|nr:hypothetical protein BYT27DRAFT_7255660 [Phlegmacium glaucopus]